MQKATIQQRIDAEKTVIKLIKARNKRNMLRICTTMGLWLPVAAYDWLGGATIASRSKMRLESLEKALELYGVVE